MSISTRSGPCSSASSTRALAGRRLERAVARGLEHVAEQPHVPLVVLHDEDLRARHRSTGLSGRVNSNVLPLPTSLSHQIRPPCISTKRFDSASPRPVPSRCLAPASVCWNSSKIRSRSSAAMPGPLSATETSHFAVDPRRADVDLPAVGRELHRVREQVEDDLPDPPLVPRDDVEAAVPVERDLDAFGRGLLTNHRDAALEGVLERERRDLQLDLAGLDLGQVEDVVDEGQQVVPRGEDVVEVLGLLRVHVADHSLAQHLREADDRVERRPQLVRHVGEEVRLVLARGLQLPVEAPELVVHPVHVRRQRTELVPVRDVHVAREVARRDRGQPGVDALDRADHRPREDEPEQTARGRSRPPPLR